MGAGMDTEPCLPDHTCNLWRSADDAQRYIDGIFTDAFYYKHFEWHKVYSTRFIERFGNVGVIVPDISESCSPTSDCNSGESGVIVSDSSDSSNEETNLISPGENDDSGNKTIVRFYGKSFQ